MSQSDTSSLAKQQNQVLTTLSGGRGHFKLALAFRLSFEQAAKAGEKGRARHSRDDAGGDGTPFDEQAIMVMSRMFGQGSLFYQAAKKMEESQRMSPVAALHELRGAMVYIGAAMLLIDEQNGGTLIDQMLDGITIDNKSE